MQFKNIVVKKTYQSKGEEKTQWLQVGTLKETDDGKQFIELNMFPATSFYVFEKRESNGNSGQRRSAPSQTDAADASDIEF